jgi:hypothetical protein
MFQSWRLQLREAEEAAGLGQLDEACHLLLQSDLRQYLPGKRLSTRVAGELAQRARRRVIQGDLSAGWRDLRAAQSLAGDVDAVLSARQEILALTLGEAESYIENGDPARAIAMIETLDRFNVHDEPLRWMKEVARRLESARHLALHGKFVEAEAQAKAADTIRPKLDYVTSRIREYHEQIEPFRQLSESLHRAMAGSQWTEVVSLADQLLERAPESRLARELRRKAWEKAGAPLSDSLAGPQATRARNGSGPRPLASDTEIRPAPGVTVAEPPAGRRFLLWIDGVGGYLVCMGDEVVLGQSSPECSLDIPIQADLSRRHARIARRGDGYVIEPLHMTRVHGQIIRGKTLLSDGDEIELAQGVRLRFRQPHALSASARLDFLSHHRTQPKADGVLLMAESCVLGPKWQNHVVCRDWQGDVVLYRRDGELCCQAMDSLEIDGRLCDGRGPLQRNSRVSGSDFSMSLEELS